MVDFLYRELIEMQTSPYQELKGWSKANLILSVERQKLPWGTCKTSLCAVVQMLSCESAPSAVTGGEIQVDHPPMQRWSDPCESGEAPPERSDVLQLCFISCRSVCIRQFSPHGYLAAVRAGRQVRAVELRESLECHVALADITQWRVKGLWQT